jgi:hypothetical protein
LNGKKSPFSKQLFWPYNSLVTDGGVLTDYLQSIVVIKNFQASEPLNN